MAKTPKASESYESMLGKVEGLIQAIQTENLDLDTMVNKVDEGYELIKKLRKKLDATQMKVEKLHEKFEEEWEEEIDQ